MRHADRKSESTIPLQETARAVPTFIATDLLEKLIAAQDAQAVNKAVTAGRRS